MRNEISAYVRDLPKKSIKSNIQSILSSVLIEEDSYFDVSMIISKIIYLTFNLVQLI